MFLWFHVGRPCVHPSIRRMSACPSVRFSFSAENLLYALTLRRSGLGLLMDKFCQIFMELSARDTHIFSFPDDNLSK